MRAIEGGFAVDWQEVRELRRMIELDGVPSDPDDLRAKFVQMVRNTEGLYILFGGQWDEGARRECFALLHAIKAAHKWEHEVNYVAPATVH